jgi:hypothetical protein
MSKRKTTTLEKTAFIFLNDLRDSGVTNMFGATPYLEDYFQTNKEVARALLLAWMNVFDPDGEYEEIDNNVKPINLT